MVVSVFEGREERRVGGGWMDELTELLDGQVEDRRRMSRNPTEIGVVFLYRVLLG